MEICNMLALKPDWARSFVSSRLYSKMLSQRQKKDGRKERRKGGKEGERKK